MSLVEIESVDRAPLDRRLRGAELDVEPGARFDTYTLAVTGWVLGRSTPAVAVELEAAAMPAWGAPVSMERRDLVDRYPELPDAPRSGFVVEASVLGFPVLFDVDVRAVLADGTRAAIGSIRVRRRPLTTEFEPSLQPLMLTSLGRTGTHWVLLVLSRHPAVVAYS